MSKELYIDSSDTPESRWRRIERDRPDLLDKMMQKSPVDYYGFLQDKARQNFNDAGRLREG